MKRIKWTLFVFVFAVMALSSIWWIGCKATTSLPRAGGRHSYPPASQQAIAQVIHGTTGTVWFVSVNGSATNSGLSPVSPKLSPKIVVEAASAYDLVIIGSGTFALGDAKITIPANVAMQGAGMDQTVITSTAKIGAGELGPIITLGNNTAVRDLTALGVGTVQAAVGSDVTSTGSSDAVFTRALVERVKGECDRSGLYIRQSNNPVSVIARDCIWVAPDGVNARAGTGVVIDLIDNQIISLDETGIEPDGLRADAGILRAWNTDIHVTTGEASGNGVLSAGGTVEMHGGSIYVDAATNDRSLYLVSGSIIVSGVDYDGGQEVVTTGNIIRTSGLALSGSTIVFGVAEAGTLSPTEMTSDLAEATNDHYIGRIIIWTSGVLKNQATDITDYTGATGFLEFTAVTDTPSAGDRFIIL